MPVPSGPTLSAETVGSDAVSFTWSPQEDFAGDLEVVDKATGTVVGVFHSAQSELTVTATGLAESTTYEFRKRFKRLAEEPTVTGASWTPDDPPVEGTTPDVQPESVDAGEYTIQSIQLVFAGTDTPVASEATETPWSGTVLDELEAGEFDVEWLTTAEGGGDAFEFRSDPITVEVVLGLLGPTFEAEILEEVVTITGATFEAEIV